MARSDGVPHLRSANGYSGGYLAGRVPVSMRYSIPVPYLLLFYGPILLMGQPMSRLDRRLWFNTVKTTVLLIGSMGIAMRKGVG